MKLLHMVGICQKLMMKKKFEELIYRLKLKGQDKIGFDISVSPPTSSNEEIRDIFICKFIVGECYILFQGDELEKSKEELAEKYDTIVKISDNESKKYEVLKPENIQLLYLVKMKDSDFEPKTIQCTGQNCKLNEPGGDLIQPQDKKMCYCLLSDNYLCKSCHLEFHQNQILFGEFGVENCEQRPFINNYQGECENPSVHQKKEIIEFFCRDCNKGLCSYCRFNSNEKHKDLCLITNLFSSYSLNEKNNTSFKEIRDEFNPKTKELSQMISEIQKNNKTAAMKLRELIMKGFKKMFNNVLVDSVFCEYAGVTCILRDENLVVESRMVEMLLDLPWKLVLVLLSGDGINDESYLQLVHKRHLLKVSNCWISSGCCILEGTCTVCRRHPYIEADQ